eukprot:CAMPEP_0206476992 /NCGR_PEP_ID=MMETSP0324_2-20121206/35073_1 /ASSEMBLY_ACC=CAM_ASM_000836 /TAXON_ID=2866 /ORGANISM="Crypthecodinium cohnii, Strain Seligo" /LENGTH=130 /DNA_ID=CAMNT_0053952783 /DNA_START=193 /DNA_END=582 /DNA_ORIENTATION=-
MGREARRTRTTCVRGSLFGDRDVAAPALAEHEFWEWCERLEMLEWWDCCGCSCGWEWECEWECCGSVRLVAAARVEGTDDVDVGGSDPPDVATSGVVKLSPLPPFVGWGRSMWGLGIFSEQIDIRASSAF